MAERVNGLEAAMFAVASPVSSNAAVEEIHFTGGQPLIASSALFARQTHTL
jgi:hypothetical protein